MCRQSSLWRLYLRILALDFLVQKNGLTRVYDQVLLDAIKYQKAGDYDHSVIGIKGVDYDSGSDIKNYLKEVVRMIARGV